ncbi:MAG: hypothetical protein M3256_26680, partial [Actinomycetota bacterium]|nr:hypothetical protein [Actinomycetota bacterium]
PNLTTSQMDDITPLGSLDAFEEWSTPRPWGPSAKRDGIRAVEDLEKLGRALGIDAGDSWRATFGGGVVADLVKGLRAHPTAVGRRFSRKAEAYPVVLGCVPWLTSKDVVDALLSMMVGPPSSHTGLWVRGGCCVIVDKGKSAGNVQLDRLSGEGLGVPQQLLGDLEYWGRTEGGRPPIIGPGTPRNEHELGPVRVVGWRQTGSRPRPVPLLHAKLAVCCAAYTWEGEMGGWNDHLMPMSVWMGSANWTELSRAHLEFGAWTTDPALAEAALKFMTDLIKVSEPWGSQAQRPSPELVAAEWDDLAFAEALAASEPEDPSEDLP